MHRLPTRFQGTVEDFLGEQVSWIGYNVASENKEAVLAGK